MDLNENDGGAQPELSNLDRIAMEAAGGEQAADSAEQEFLNPQDPHALDPAEAWGQLPLMLGGMLSMAMPELREVYTKKACYDWGAGMAMVADKYGWDANKAIGPELALLAVSVPLVVPTYFSIKLRLDARKKAAPPEPPPADVIDLNTNPMAQPPGGFVDPV